MRQDQNREKTRIVLMIAGLTVILIMMTLALIMDFRNADHDSRMQTDSAGELVSTKDNGMQENEHPAAPAGNADSTDNMDWEMKLQSYLEERDPGEPTVNDFLGGDSAWLSEIELEGTDMEMVSVAYANRETEAYVFADGGMLTVGCDDESIKDRLILCPKYAAGEDEPDGIWGIYMATSGGRLLLSQENGVDREEKGKQTYVIANHTFDTAIPSQNTAWKIDSDFGDCSDTVFINNIVPEYRIKLRVADMRSRRIVAAAVCKVEYLEGAYAITELENSDIGEYAEYSELRERAVETAAEFITDDKTGPSFLKAADHKDAMKENAVVEFTDSLYFGYCAGPHGEFVRNGELTWLGKMIAVSAFHPGIGNITVYLMSEDQINGKRKTEPFDDPDVELYPIGYDFLLPEKADTIHIPGPAAEAYDRYRVSTGRY